MVLENIVPPLFDAVLFDYQKNVPAAREPKVLSLLSIIVTKLGVRLQIIALDKGRPDERLGSYGYHIYVFREWVDCYCLKLFPFLFV